MKSCDSEIISFWESVHQEAIKLYNEIGEEFKVENRHSVFVLKIEFEKKIKYLGFTRIGTTFFFRLTLIVHKQRKSKLIIIVLIYYNINFNNLFFYF